MALRKEERYKKGLAMIDEFWECWSSVQHEISVLRLICQCDLGHWQGELKTAQNLDAEIWPEERIRRSS